MTSVSRQGKQQARSDPHHEESAEANAQTTARTNAEGARRSGRTGMPAATAGHEEFMRHYAAAFSKLRTERLADKLIGLAAAELSGERPGPRRGMPEDDEDGDPALAAVEVLPPRIQDPFGWQAQSGQGGTSMRSMSNVQAGTGESLDLQLLATLLPGEGDHGVFDVMLPTGARIGVSASEQQSGLSYLLMPEGAQLSSMLHGHERELEDFLKRRIRRNVSVAVL